MDTLEFNKLAEVVNANKSRLPYDKYKHLFVKVAFDVFQPSGSPVESYWLLEKCEDGKEYLVATYGDAEESLVSNSNWEALEDKKAENITVAYKGMPLKRLSSEEFGFSKEDVGIFKSAVVSRLNNDKEFVSKLLSEFNEERRQALLQLFPELA